MPVIQTLSSKGDTPAYSISGDGGVETLSSLGSLLLRRATVSDSSYGRGRSAATLDQNIVEAWSQGLLFGTTIVLIMFTIANMRRHVLLHKLILVELCFILGHGTFIFCQDPVYGWYLSATAVPIYQCWPLHNVIAWIKNRSFLPRWGSRVYIITVALTYPFWIAQTVLNFYWFNSLGNDGFRHTRPYETFFRDPWWIFTTFSLIYVIHQQYSIPLPTLMKTSPRFGMLMMCMFFAIVFAMADLAVSFKGIGGVNGINPYWKLSTVFKCASDTLFLDDFKKVLDQLTAVAMRDINEDSASLREAITCRDLPPATPASVRTGAGVGGEGGEMDFGTALQALEPSATHVSTRTDDLVLGLGAGGHKGRKGGGGRTRKRAGTFSSLFRSKTKAEGQTTATTNQPADGADPEKQVLPITEEDQPRGSVEAGDVNRMSSISKKATYSPRSSRLSGTGSGGRVEWFDVVGENEVVVDDVIDNDDDEDKDKPVASHHEDIEKKTDGSLKEEREQLEHGDESQQVEFEDVGGLAGIDKTK